MRVLLYVDDNAAQRKLIRRLLDTMDEWTLVECSTAEDALNIATVDLPDAIALDFRLPGMSGICVAGQLRENVRTRSVPLIAVSGQDVSEVLASREDRELFSFVLRKPFDIFRFKEILERILPG